MFFYCYITDAFMKVFLWKKKSIYKTTEPEQITARMVNQLSSSWARPQDSIFTVVSSIPSIRQKIASAGNRTRVNCLEGSYAHHYTTDGLTRSSSKRKKNHFYRNLIRANTLLVTRSYLKTPFHKTTLLAKHFRRPH